VTAPEITAADLMSRTRAARGDGGADPAEGEAWLANGFRPFFLLAGWFAVFAMPVWLLALFAGIRPGGPAGAMHWHAHEMIYGFAIAVIAGFLLTAVSRWTSRETATGLGLGALAMLWLAGRLAVLMEAAVPSWLVSAIDLAFLPALAVVIARPIVASRNRRNYAFIALVSLLWALDVAGHLDGFGLAEAWQRRSTLIAVDVIVLVIVVITGRVVPMFTRNATGRPDIAGSAWLDRLAVIALIALLAAELVGAPPMLVAAAAVAAAAATLLRTRRWGSLAAMREPMLWVLHLGHLWVPVGLALRAAAELGAVSPVAATHALTAGAIGTLTLGMMVRVGLGHTGRDIVAPWPVVVAFCCVLAAALVRVGAAVALPQWYRGSLIVSGTLWTIAFAIYLITQTHVLTSPRADGRPG
jgi:uncharacterized protein involved in response to NO